MSEQSKKQKLEFQFPRRKGQPLPSPTSKEEAERRVSMRRKDYLEISEKEQWAEDKRLGLLDYDPTSSRGF